MKAGSADLPAVAELGHGALAAAPMPTVNRGRDRIEGKKGESMFADRRHDPRVRVKVRLTVREPATGREIVLHTTNLSAGGASCTALGAVEWSGDLPGRLDIPISEGGRDFEVPIAVTARFLRRVGEQVAVEFHVDEGARDELRQVLLDCMAADCVGSGALVGAGS